jgi:type I restriction enzyme, S subunit
VFVSASFIAIDLQRDQLMRNVLPNRWLCRASLDEAFEGIATAKANAEKNLRNAREWATRQLTRVLEAQSAGGASGVLESLVVSGCSLSYGIVQPGDEVPGGLPVVRPVDLGAKTVREEGLKRIDPALAGPYSRTTLEGGDLLLCVRGTTGTVGVAEPGLAGANVTRGIVPVRFDPEFVRQDLGYYLLRSEPFQAQIRAKTYGTALMQINIGDLRKTELTFPPIDQQAALVKRLDAVQESADQLASIYERKLAALDELKKSLLHQAFSGAL